MAEERVQKILARAGYGSRRASEELITAGRVKINGQAAVLGSKADPARDTITIDNQPIARAQALTYIAVNKPQGVLSEVSPDEPRDTVRDLVPVPGHLFIVGRLDMESEGLILLTNDGELANHLSHPRYGHEKEYRVLVGTRPDDRQLDAWRHGVVLEDGYRTAPAQVRIETVAGKGAWLRVILREGRKRQIREMGKLTGVPVLRIQRLRIGSLLLGDMKPGEWRELRPDEVRALKVNKAYREPQRRELPRREATHRGAPGDEPHGHHTSGETSRPRRHPAQPHEENPRPRRSGPSAEGRGEESPRPSRRPAPFRSDRPSGSAPDRKPFGIRRPSSGTARPSSGTSRPSSGTAKPSSGTTRPSSGPGRPASGTTRPSSGTGRPSTGTGRPPTGSDRPSRPGSGSSRPPARTPRREPRKGS